MSILEKRRLVYKELLRVTLKILYEQTKDLIY